MIISDHDLDFNFRQEIDDVLSTSIKLGMALLPPISLGFDYSHALNTKVLQRFLHLIEFEGFNDGFDLLHDLNV